MRSRTSFFNPSIFRKNILRFWPLWAAWFAVWLLLPILLLNEGRYSVSEIGLSASVMGTGVYGGVVGGVIMAIMAAMAVWGFLYHPRSAHGIACLPVKREGLFLTNLLAGLAPVLAANVLIALLTVLAGLALHALLLKAALQWLALVSLVYFFFYCFATLCAMLTGHILILPAVYVVLNFVVIGVDFLLRSVFSFFVYGLRGGNFTGDGIARALSPAVGLLTALDLHYTYPNAEAQMNYGRSAATRVDITGWGTVLIYCLAGLLLLCGALALYRRRRMESAGDVVAVQFLKPVFRWCMGLGCGLVLSSLMYLLMFMDWDSRSAVFLGLLVSLFVGAFIGWFASEMLMKKTFRVFHGRQWAGYGLCCLVIAALMLGMRIDLFGVERRVPATDRIECVTVQAGGEYVVLREPESIDLVRELHKQIIADKNWNWQEPDWATQSSVYCFLRYEYSGGDGLVRGYGLLYEDADPAGRGDVAALNAVMNCPEAISYRKHSDQPVTRETIYSGSVSVTLPVTEAAAVKGYDDPEEFLLCEYLGYDPEIAASMDPKERRTLAAQVIYDNGVNGYDLALEAIQGREGVDYYEEMVAALAEHPDYDRAFIETYVFYSAAELADLYLNCIVPDMEDGTIGKVWVVPDKEYDEKVCLARIEIQTRVKDANSGLGDVMAEGYTHGYFYTYPTMDSLRTVNWLRDKGLELHTRAELGLGGSGEPTVQPRYR